MDAISGPWASRWRVVRPNAAYNHTFGFETQWRQNFASWGYPLEDLEDTVTIGGVGYPCRTFHKIGLVYWDPAKGAIVYGWK